MLSSPFANFGLILNDEKVNTIISHALSIIHLFNSTSNSAASGQTQLITEGKFRDSKKSRR